MRKTNKDGMIRMSPKAFCADCGKQDTFLLQSLCPDCYYHRYLALEVKTPIANVICKRCGATQKNNWWLSPPRADADYRELLTTAAYNAVSDAINQKPRGGDLSSSIEITREIIPHIPEYIDVPRVCEIPVTIVSTWVPAPNETPIREERNVKVTITQTVCRTCAQIMRGYSEALIQIRAPRGDNRFDRKYVEEVVESTQKIASYHPRSAITAVRYQSNGVDLSFNNKPLAYTVIRYLQKRYHAEVKQSFKGTHLKDGLLMRRLVFSATFPLIIEGKPKDAENSKRGSSIRAIGGN